MCGIFRAAFAGMSCLVQWFLTRTRWWSFSTLHSRKLSTFLRRPEGVVEVSRRASQSVSLQWTPYEYVHHTFSHAQPPNYNILHFLSCVILLRVLHRRIVVYRILYKIQRVRASLATAIIIYDDKLSDCLLSRSQRLVGL